MTKEIRELIFQMVAENPTWRAPRIHGELAMLGFDVSERSVSRWMQRAPLNTRIGAALAHLLTKSPGSNCCYGLLLRTDADVQRAVRLLHHWA